MESVKDDVKHVNDIINNANKERKAFYDEAFKNHDVPRQIMKASIRICDNYGIKGICDPMYIANIIAQNMNVGDGQSNFKDYIITT